LALVPLAGATLVAISRTMDYRHHWQDVVVGSALGLTTAYFSYRQYYPSLTALHSERPYAPRPVRGSEQQEGGAMLPTFRRQNGTRAGAGTGVEGDVESPLGPGVGRQGHYRDEELSGDELDQALEAGG